MGKQQSNHPERYLRPRVDVKKIEPHYEDRIAIRRLEWPSEEHGILVPESARSQEGPQLGEIIAVGPGRTYRTNLSSGAITRFAPGVRDEFSVKVGDVVLYSRSCVNEVETGDWGTVTFGFEEQCILAVLDGYRETHPAA